MSYDAFRYLAGADSILASGSYLAPSGAPQSLLPPGTSILYAVAGSLSGRPPEELVEFVNLAALLLTAGSLWVAIEVTIERWWIAIITFASILLNTGILSLHNKLWSDPLALAISSAAIASGIVACRGGKNWFGWICLASVFLSIAICLRFAMLPGIPILTAVAFWLSKRSASHREAVLFPLLSPLVTLISFYLLGSSPFSHSNAYSPIALVTITAFDIQNQWPAFLPVGYQFLPAVVPTWISLSIVVLVLIAVPTGVAFASSTTPEKRGVLVVCVGYILLSCIFFVISQASVHNQTQFRYLLLVYPILLIGAALAADLLLSRRRLALQILGFFIIGLLSIAAVRSIRAASLGILSHGAQQSAVCVSRETLLDDLKRIPPIQNASRVLTNIQGLAWYALRIPIVELTSSSLADASSGTVIIFARPKHLCPDILESEQVDEITLTRAPDVRIISSGGALLISRKE